MTRPWIVDGMNVIGSRPDGWWKNRTGAMQALVESLDSFARATGDEIIVVFDQDPQMDSPDGSVRIVVASRRGPNAADHEIVDLVKRAEDPSGLRVVTSDKWLRDQVDSLGANVVPSGTFRKRLTSPAGH